MSPAVERVLDALRTCGCNPIPNGSGYKFRCPAHDDSSPSGSLNEGDGGCAVLKCHANHGCTCEAIIERIGLKMRDLFADAPKAERREVAAYDYHDADGTLLFQVVRYSDKTFPQRRPDGRGGWTWGLGDVRRVLYNLPGVVVAVASDWTVYVCEGEKDVDAVLAVESGADFYATCNPMGAGKWRPEYSEVLRGARVVIVADKDEAGRKHALDVRASLRDVKASVEIVQAKEGKDAADHLAAGHGLADFVPMPEPGSIDDAAPTFEWIRLSVREALSPNVKPIDWIMQGIAGRGEVETLTAPPGLGKTTILMGLIAHACVGRTALGCYDVPKAIKALWIDEEMGVEMLSALLTRIVLGDRFTPKELDLLATNLDIRPQQGLSLGNAESFAAYDRTLREGRYDVVGMDSMVALSTGKENDANDNRSFYDRCIAPYKGQLKTTFMLAAHPPKPSQQAAPGAQQHARGTGDKIAMVDREFWLEKQAEEITEDSHVLKVILNRAKQRRAGSVDGHLIVIDGPQDKPLIIRSLGATGSPAAVQEIGKINACQHEILARLRAAQDRKLYQPDVIRELEALGFDRRHHYYPAVNVLESQKFVRCLDAVAGSGKSGKWIQLLDVDDE